MKNEQIHPDWCPQRHPRSGLVWLLVLLAGVLLAIAPVGAVEPIDVLAAAAPAVPAWLEARGLSIVDLAGQVPDPYLAGTIVSYGNGDGIVVFQSGNRSGDTLTIVATLYPRLMPASWVPGGQLTRFGCLGQAPHYDHMGSVVPASILRVYDGAREVTSEIQYMTITRMDMNLPLANSKEYFRYPQQEYGPGMPLSLPLFSDGLHIPSNSGCSISIPSRDYHTLTGVFSLSLSSSPGVWVVGSQQATFQSYIGPGGLGIFQPLMAQLRNRYDDRDGRVALAVPDDADLVLLKYPPMPGDAYTDYGLSYYPNAARLSSGTYRFSSRTTALSTDLVFSAGWPLARAWQDADQVSGSTYLPTLSPLLDLATPEYVIPAGIPYNACFTAGNCSSTILTQIYNAQMSLELIYLRVRRPLNEGQWIPVRLAGPAWPSLALQPAPVERNPSIAVSSSPTNTVFFPVILAGGPENVGNCPCGWFDNLGRMLDFSPAP